jgi:hypothetical protein
MFRKVYSRDLRDFWQYAVFYRSQTPTECTIGALDDLQVTRTLVSDFMSRSAGDNLAVEFVWKQCARWRRGLRFQHVECQHTCRVSEAVADCRFRSRLVCEGWCRKDETVCGNYGHSPALPVPCVTKGHHDASDFLEIASKSPYSQHRAHEIHKTPLHLAPTEQHSPRSVVWAMASNTSPISP